MTSQQAEIASPSGGEPVDSGATTDGTEVSATSADETGAAKTETESRESPEKKRDDGQERFDKLTRDLYELRSEIDRGRYDREERDKKIAALEAKLAETAKPSQVAPDTLPTLESVGYDEQKYVAALSQHFTTVAKEQGKNAAQEAFRDFMAQQNAQSTHSAWAKREADFIKSTPDYVSKVKNARELPISSEMQQTLLQMDDGPQLAYYLVANPEKALAIKQMPPQFQMIEIGRIQGEIAGKKTAAPPVSKAPPPVSKVDATDAPNNFKVDSAESDQLSDAEWTRRRNAQELARRRKAG